MEIFLWGKDVERVVREVREHAEKPENWYRVGGGTPPGEDPRFVVWSGTTRAVFTWTVMPLSLNPKHPPAGSLLRHLTVSVRGENIYPRPEVCWTLAHYFGFTGATPDEHGLYREPAPTWVLGLDEDDQCAIIQQLVEGVRDERPPSTAH